MPDPTTAGPPPRPPTERDREKRVRILWHPEVIRAAWWVRITCVAIWVALTLWFLKELVQGFVQAGKFR